MFPLTRALLADCMRNDVDYYARKKVYDKIIDELYAAENTRERQTLEAIKARINGVWDNPSLVAVGPLTPDVELDIKHIIEYYEV